MKKIPELLAPAGIPEKLPYALHFGADAVYLGGKEFGLRAFCENFDDTELCDAVRYSHERGKKVYVTLNIFAKNADFGKIGEFVKVIEKSCADGVIISDAGVIDFVKKVSPKTEIHLSTQANTLNKYAAGFWAECGVKRIVLAREVSLDEIKEIKDYIGEKAELEVFIHGAMCISYSGRCLLSTWLTPRDSNRGECVQACRWEYEIGEKNRDGKLTLQEDRRGSYILNSKDMNTMPILDKIIETGVSSLKIEGRMKSAYYAGAVVRAYRKRIDDYFAGKPYDKTLESELEKVTHREYTTGFYIGNAEQCYETSKPANDYKYCADVTGYDEERGMLEIVQRNRFFSSDELEAVTNREVKTLRPEEIYDEKGERVTDCKLVMQKLFVKTDIRLDKYDILRKKVD